MISDREVMETLESALHSLNSNAPFDFGDWRICTCGHIYTAAMGRVSHTGLTVTTPTVGNQRYMEVMTRTAQVLGWQGSDHHEGHLTPWGFVSDYTAELSWVDDDGHRCVERDHAADTIEAALHELFTLQEQARLDVLAQLEEVEAERPATQLVPA